MDNSHNLEITLNLPCDDEGFTLLQCPVCGARFKLLPADVKDESVVEVRCPCCGIASDGYATDEVVELAKAMVANAVNSQLYAELEKLERKTKGDFIRVEAGKRPQEIPEVLAASRDEDLTRVACPHCNRESKVPAANALSAYTCPYCGVKNFNG